MSRPGIARDRRAVEHEFELRVRGAPGRVVEQGQLEVPRAVERAAVGGAEAVAADFGVAREVEQRVDAAAGALSRFQDPHPGACLLEQQGRVQA